jgi:excisionase family DNA binding protein
MANATASVQQLLFSVTQVARMIGLSRSKTYEMVRQGKIPSITMEGRTRVTRDALYRWINQQPQRRFLA